MTKEEILVILKENRDEFISGEELSNKFGVSRAAVWKHIKSLKEDGYNIESISRRGYRIIENADVLTYEEIKNYLETKFVGQNIIHYDTIDSTNLKAKELANDSSIKEGTIITSEEQTRGKGRLGRVWESPKSTGIWFSIILKPNISPMNVSNITLLGAAAVNLALSDLNIESKIKWPNDVLVNSKKVCGILTEMSAELDEINYIVMGIGINVNMTENDFSEELRKKATSLKSEYKKQFCRKQILAKILNYFEKMYIEYVENNSLEQCINVCRDNSILIGREVYIKERGQSNKIKVIDINSEGHLVVERDNNSIDEIISGEVSIDGVYGVL